ncbi:hypothetical protein FI667_g3960, partial [Globisporangium splendens]
MSSARSLTTPSRSSSTSSLQGSPRETWVYRSTIGAYSDDEESDYIEHWSEAGEERRSSTNYDVTYDSYRHSPNGSVEEMEAQSCLQNRAAAEVLATKQALFEDGSKLRRIPGFSNKEALKVHLPIRRPPVLPTTSASIQQTTRQKGKRCDTNFGRSVMVKQQFQSSSRDLFQEKSLDHKIAMHEELMRNDRMDEFATSLDRKIAMHEELTRNLKTGEAQYARATFPQVELEPRPAFTYRMGTMMVYSIVFTSSTTLHCAIFNFSLELRRFFQLDMLPFGVFLLVCWTIFGLLSFAGGWIGDLVPDRVWLLRLAALLWAVAVFVLHMAAFRATSSFSFVCLSVALPCASMAHGIFAPNCIVLGVDKYMGANDRRRLKQYSSSSSRTCTDNDSEVDLANKFKDERPDDEDVLTAHLNAVRKMAIRKYFSRCFAATLTGSSCTQLYFFLLVDLEIPLEPSRKSLMGWKGFCYMLLSSVLLLSTLICFMFQSRNHFQPPALSFFERKLASLEENRKRFSWKAIIRVFSRAFVGYALFLSSLVTVVGVCSALIGLLTLPDSSFNLRFAAFLMVLVGWYMITTIGRVQLSEKSNLSKKCNDLGIPLFQLQSVLLVLFFLGMSAFSAFLRAQLYTTLVAQTCQTRLDLPGASGTLFNPDALGALVSIISLLLIPISNAAKFSGFKKPATDGSAAIRIVSLSPSRRLSIATLLYLVGIFLSSVVELYRRTHVVVTDPQPKCNKSYSDFAVAWTAPHLVFLGLSDMVFRVSLQEQFHSIDLLTSQWPGLMQGMIEFSEMIGYVAALALTSMLSSWIFRPSTSDLATVFLLMTTLLAFSYSSLKRIAQKIDNDQFKAEEGPG